MKTSITVREYASLTTEPVVESSLDRARISTSAFDWLCRTNSNLSMGGPPLLGIDGRHTLRLDSYVGVIETPCGTQIEILPKIFDDVGGAATSRSVLWRMIATALDLPTREVGETTLQTFTAPTSEWVMGRFLRALNHLVKRGVRFEYSRVDASEPFLRGQLDIARQLLQPPGRQHIFEIRHDLFVPDRPENRLLKRALDQVARLAQLPPNWRLAQELRTLLRDVPASADVERDFRAWRSDRLMAHYQSIRPWCELVLHRSMPYSLIGDWHGISLLFPMEKLFERFVAGWLKQRVGADVRFRTQAASEFLCLHQGSPMFRLEPDILLERGEERWVVDTKWKRLDANDRANKYGLSQADLYQLYAYGMKYLGVEGGDMALIYPLGRRFWEPLPDFDLGHGRTLHVLPFDLQCEELLGFERARLPLLRESVAA